MAAGLIKIILIRSHFRLAKQMAVKVGLLPWAHSDTFASLSKDLIQLGFLLSCSCYVKNPFAFGERKNIASLGGKKMPPPLNFSFPGIGIDIDILKTV